VTAVFGKTGYALSLVARADRVGITPGIVRALWAELTVVNEKAAAAK
jgi:hypothetical protein